MLDQISTRIFADGADLDGIIALAADSRISGFTTNTTLMRKVGLTDYARFARELLERVTRHPISRSWANWPRPARSCWARWLTCPAPKTWPGWWSWR